ncbi:aminopeptidase family protein P [Rickettsiaceae bacterium]|nr:aminopeptidase family protein P [Rickettsiaceae bacterium]
MIDERLDKLRVLLDHHDFDGYIVPSTDEYLSEYTPNYAKRLEYITGFTGSNGLAFILKNTVLFFTDGRYITQSIEELDDHSFEVFDLKLLSNFSWANYTNDQGKYVIAYDPKLFTKHIIKHLQGCFSNIENATLKPYNRNLIDEIWQDQPLKPSSKIYNYPLEYAGLKYQDKIQKCRDFLKENASEALVITDAPSVCWLFNIRAHDIEFSPLLLANAIITATEAYLFADNERCEESLMRLDISILPEDEFDNILKQFSGTILFDESECSSYISDLISSRETESRRIKNPCMLWKACKNNVEIDHIKEAHIKDAVAVCELLSFIDHGNISDLTEYDISQKLTELRMRGDGYIFDSFPTICGYQENGAIIHYTAKKESAKKLEGNGLLLIDSGGQYLGATTDITRTISIGRPTKEHKEYYTKLLKGHIALGLSVFPEDKTTGANLDVLARQYLWNSGDDYAHATGHGVGSFLSVHEGPQNISPVGFNVKLQRGMVLSNEPGYYDSVNKFGIRIENMMHVVDSEYDDFLKFEMLTLVPCAKELIDFSVITDGELKYLKSYYQRIKKNILPLLSDTAKKWVKQQLSI